MALKRSFGALSALDRIVHEPARLAVLTALSACKSAEFMYLLALTELSPGNLSLHLSKLAEHGLVSVEKGFAGKYPRTSVHITEAGRTAIAAHWRQLEQLKQAAAHLPPHGGVARIST